MRDRVGYTYTGKRGILTSNQSLYTHCSIFMYWTFNDAVTCQTTCVSSNVGNVSKFGIEMDVKRSGCVAVLSSYHNICPEGLRKNIKIVTRNCSRLTV